MHNENNALDNAVAEATKIAMDLRIFGLVVELPYQRHIHILLAKQDKRVMVLGENTGKAKKLLPYFASFYMN